MSDNDELLSADHRLPQNPVLPDAQVLLVNERRGLDGVGVNLVASVQDAVDLMSWLGERRPVLAVDTETTGFDAWNGDLRLVQIGDGMIGWAIPWQQWGGVFLEAMEKYEGPITGHNMAFDARWLTVHTPWEVPWHRTHDTMIMAHVIDPTQAVGLKGLSNRFVDRRASAGEILLKQAFHDNKWDWATVPIDFGPYWEYAALDTVLTARLWELFRADLRYPAVYDLEMATRRICSAMEDRGSPIDLDYCQQQFDGLSTYVAEMKDWFQENHHVSVTSPTQLVRWFQELGAEITRTTASGKPAMDKAQLMLLADEFPLAKTILDTRRAEKLANTYFLNFIDKAVDGVLHCSIRTLGARTGRMSITDPALQTLPKGEALVRNAFIAREGEVVVTCDLDQVEARLLAHFSRDAGLSAAFAAPEDFFLTIARTLFNDPELGMKDKRRKLTKNTIYAKMYGAGPAKMAATAGVSEAAMKNVLEALDTNYPGITSFAKQVEQVGLHRLQTEGVAYVNTPLGRRLPADDTRVYTLTNYIIQSTAAEVFKRGIVRADAAGLGEYMTLPVHDEIVMTVPAAEAEAAKRELQRAMTVDDGSFSVPLTASAEGPYARWGDSID